jgi:hypothetical protein
VRRQIGSVEEIYVDKDTMINLCRDALWQIINEHKSNEAKMRADVIPQTAAAYFASTRVAMIAIETLQGINAISGADATRLISETAAAVTTAMSIVTIDQIDRKVGFSAENCRSGGS